MTFSLVSITATPSTANAGDPIDIEAVIHSDLWAPTEWILEFSDGVLASGNWGYAPGVVAPGDYTISTTVALSGNGAIDVIVRTGDSDHPELNFAQTVFGIATVRSAIITATLTFPTSRHGHVDVGVTYGSGAYDVYYYWAIVDGQPLPATPDHINTIHALSDSQDVTYPPGSFDDFTSFHSSLEVAVRVLDRTTGDLSNVVYLPIALPHPSASISPVQGNIPLPVTMTIIGSEGTPFTGPPVAYNYSYSLPIDTRVTTNPVDTVVAMTPVVNAFSQCRIDYEGYFVFAIPPQRFTVTDHPNLATAGGAFRVAFE